jgi:hypothetical protein
MVKRALILATLALVGCGHSVTADSSRSWPQVATSPIEEYDFETLVRWSAELDDALEAHTRECMTHAGFSQLAQAYDLASVQPVQGERLTLSFDPLEAGPYTDRQAREYGMVGTVYAFDAGEPGYVVSRSVPYDSQLSRCRKSFAAGNGTAVEALLARFSELRNAMRRALLQGTESSIERILSARLACVRARGYPEISVEKQLSMTELLLSAGVASGVTPPRPTEAEPVPGEVKVYPPRLAGRYVPSAEETAFAMVYVACGRETNFEASWSAAQDVTRAAILAARARELKEVGARMAAVRTALDAK